MFISSVGGHLTQLLNLKEMFNDYNYILITEKTKVTKDLKNKYNVRYLLYGSRKYMFSYLFKIPINIIKSTYYFFKYKPDTIITTGAHTAVYMCYLGHLFKKKIIFIESFAKSDSPTLSGRLVYKIADTFVVQWESMKKFYPKAECWGWIY
jgi:UDP-N-acetylglucosamine:LPS N-acetylglucosamine transferase